VYLSKYARFYLQFWEVQNCARLNFFLRVSLRRTFSTTSFDSRKKIQPGAILNFPGVVCFSASYAQFYCYFSWYNLGVEYMKIFEKYKRIFGVLASVLVVGFLVFVPVSVTFDYDDTLVVSIDVLVSDATNMGNAAGAEAASATANANAEASGDATDAAVARNTAAVASGLSGSSTGAAIGAAVSTAGAWIIGAFNALLSGISGLLGAVAILLLNVVMMPVIQYSKFIDHTIVITGWTLMRDITNVGFIGLMLFISFGTMLGISKVNWTQNVPRLAIAAILVNFSRLIVGLLIDFGQVIMIGFVNAISLAGAGNFMELLKVNAFGSFSITAKSTDAVMLFMSSVLSVIMMLIVVIVIALICGLFVYRIVLLWILIILSPLAFLAGAANSIIPVAGSMYSKWLSKLTAAVTIGPILTFFLWLALSSSTTMVTSSTFNIGSDGSSPSSNLVTQVASLENMTGFIVAIAFLLAGLEMASSTASAMGGAAGSMASKAALIDTILLVISVVDVLLRRMLLMLIGSVSE